MDFPDFERIGDMISPVIYRVRLDQEAPEWKKLQFNHRIRAKLQSDDVSETFFILAVANLFAFLYTALLFASGPFAMFASVLSTTLSLSLPVGLIALINARGDWRATLYSFLRYLLFPLSIAFFYWISHFSVLVALFHLAGLVLLFYLADSIARHFYCWLIADHRISDEVRRQRLDWFNHRFAPFYLRRLQRTLKQEQVRAEQSGDGAATRLAVRRLGDLTAIIRYCDGYILVLLLVLILPHLPAWLAPALLSFFLLPLAALLWFFIIAPRGTTFRHLFSSLWMAMCSWITYGMVLHMPGIFRSPCGRMNRRRLLTAFAVTAFAITAIPVNHYFPIGEQLATLVGNTGWSDQFSASSRDPDSWISFLANREPKPPETPETPETPPLPPFASIEQRVKAQQELKAQKELKAQQRFKAQQQFEAQRYVTPQSPFDAYLTTHPFGWGMIALDGLWDKPWFGFALMLGFAASLLFPMLALLTTFTIVAGPALASAYGSFHGPSAPECQTNLTDWELRVRKLRASTTPLEAQHLWLGTHTPYDFPILLHRDILAEHAYIVGDSGSGKTTLGLTPLLTQLIRHRESAIVVIDLKGDASLFEAVRIEAEASGATFKFFTNELGKTTYTFNPFNLKNIESISLNQLCETFLEALSLSHGEGYGRSYFSRMARRWLAATLRKNPHLQSFEELYELTQHRSAFQNAEEKENVFELISVIESLASFEQLNLTSKRARENPEALAHAIHMPDVIREKQIVYFWLPAAIEAATVREIAKLALYSLLHSAFLDNKSKMPGEKRSQTYLVIDEFQRIAAENFKIILEQARGMGIGAILANQTFEDLRTTDSDLRSTVETNTRFKLCFSASDLNQQDRIMKASGEAYRWTHSLSVTTGKNASSRTRTKTEYIGPRIERNAIIIISDHPFHCIAHIARGSGYSQFAGFSFPVKTSYAISAEEYRKRMTAPWPALTNATIIAKREPIPPGSFATPEQRLEAAAQIYPKAAQTEPSLGASHPPAKHDWTENLEMLQDSLFNPKA